MDQLSRNEDLQERLLAAPEWDLLVCDEAHRMAGTYQGGEVKLTKRYHLGRNAGSHCRNLLLMTATPHNGKEEDFQLFLALLDERVQDTLGSIQTVMDESPPEERARAFGRRRDEIASWEPEWFLLEAEFELYAARNPEVRERIAKRQQQTREVIEDALRRHIDELGLKPAYPVEELAKLIVAAGDGMSLMALNNPEGTDTSELMRILLEVLARGATEA